MDSSFDSKPNTPFGKILQTKDSLLSPISFLDRASKSDDEDESFGSKKDNDESFGSKKEDESFGSKKEDDEDGEKDKPVAEYEPTLALESESDTSFEKPNFSRKGMKAWN